MKKLSRRQVIKAGAGAATLLATSCVSKPFQNAVSDRTIATEPNSFEFIIIGSGAGGGPLAARLAREKFSVLLLEAGPDITSEYTRLPVAHGRATDDPAINWSFYCNRYDKDSSYQVYDQKSSKRVEGKGIYYPRASSLGGCTNVNAMIHLYPDNLDWDNIANTVSDSADGADNSWSAASMRKIYESMVYKPQLSQVKGQTQAEYVRALAEQDFKNGWLNLSQAPINLIFEDWTLLNFVLGALGEQGLLKELGNIKRYELVNLFKDKTIKLDPNIKKYIKDKYDGLFNIPINQVGGVRTGLSQYLREVAAKYPNLVIRTDSLCKRLVFDESGRNRIVGVEYAQGSHIYEASGRTKAEYRLAPIAFAKKEVIVSGGAFNSPQILMLSGIGDAAHLKSVGIQPRVDLPGVGRNLQDRYEVSVVSELNAPIQLIKDCKFGESPDPCFSEWARQPEGNLYSTNGVVISMITRSSQQKESPDLCVFGVPGYFKGYYPKWSKDAYRPNYFTWAILKGHSNNIAGRVSLKSNDFRDMPNINFRYFENGSPGYEDDLRSVVAGIKKARGINSRLIGNAIKSEVFPGAGIQVDDDLKSWIKQESWGHHASCTNRMGSFNRSKTAVVDSQFRVRDVEGLRIVDSSIFPDIPGLFLVLPTLMISEKAADDIIKQYRG